jgi:alginate O-acetyltransferase complex protein AlgI
MDSEILVQTLGPVALGAIFTVSGLLDAEPRWLGRLGFLVAQLAMIYASGFGSIAALGLVACMLLGFALCAGRPDSSPRLRIAGVAGFFALYVLYWAFQKYLVPLLIMSAAAAGSGALSHAQSVASIIAVVGISYIGFKFIHVYVDYRAGHIGKLEPLSFLSWLLFFPSIVAGPMQRYQDWQDQFGRRGLTVDEAVWGLRRILVGLFMKVAIADNIHALTLPSMSSGTLVTAPWVSIVAASMIYSLYLYFDFSGYCHIAIGTGVFWGIRLPENFNNPYIARNLMEFWNRWHITLSEILRDYLFYPLSFSLKRSPRFRKWPSLTTALPPLITFLLAGIWHGAGVTYALYGSIHGVGLAYIALRRRRRQPHAGIGIGSEKSAVRHWCSVAFTFAYVTFSFVFFSMPMDKLEVLGNRLIGR